MNLPACAVYERPCLTHIEIRRSTCLAAGLYQIQVVPVVLQCRLGNLQKLLIRAPCEISDRNVGDQAQLHAPLRFFAREIRFQRTLIKATYSAPNVQLVARQPYLKTVISRGDVLIRC
ncbi:hypothetical protein D3C71_1741020 [compost metagenome]